MLTCAALNIPISRENAYAANRILINYVLIHVNQVVASEVSEGEKVVAVASGILEASVTLRVSEGSAVLEARPNLETRNLQGLKNTRIFETHFGIGDKIATLFVMAELVTEHQIVKTPSRCFWSS